MNDEKDRLGEKLHQIESGREDQWAAEQDRRLIEKLRRKQSKLEAAAKDLREAVVEASQSLGRLCPHCKRPLNQVKRASMTAWTCPEEAGAWLDRGTLETLLKRAKMSLEFF
jgi:ribosomal protein L37AE/L43A